MQTSNIRQVSVFALKLKQDNRIVIQLNSV